MATISTKEEERTGNDIAAALAAGVTVNGTPGSDIITPTETVPEQPFPGDDDDTIHGLAGNDTIDGGAGADQMYGGTGDDTFYVDNAGDRVFELQGQAQGRDRVFSSVSYSLAGQFIETLTLTGDANINALGNSQANVLDGNAGNNILDGGAGADLMRGGAGDDTYVVDHAADRITEIDETGADAGGLDTVKSSISFALTGLSYVENLTLTGTEAIDGTGNILGNVLTGNAAANSLDGDAGNDTLWGHEGDDTLNGGWGDDTLWGEDGDDTLDGGAHSDTLWGQDGNDTLDGGIGADQMYGGTGDDTYYVDDADDLVVESEGQGNDQIFSSVSVSLGEYVEVSEFDLEYQDRVFVETVTLTGNDDISVFGTSKANTLIGNSGSNAFRGQGGADVMRGGAGDDTYMVDSSDDVVDETDGAGGDAGGVDRIWIEVPDRSHISISLTGLAAHVEDVEIYSRDYSASVEVTGNDLKNRLICQADPQATVTLDGRGGDDELRGGNNGDRLYGGDGNDNLDGNGGDDQLHGGAGDDVLYGTRGDLLFGDEGQDLLISASSSYGSDRLSGGADADIFYFAMRGPAAGPSASSTLEGFSTITDFSRADGDRIDVTSGGTLAFRGEVSTPGFTLTEGATLGGDDIDPGYTQLWSYRDDATTYLIGDVNDNRTLDATDLVVALTGPTAPTLLAESDFVDGSFVALG